VLNVLNIGDGIITGDNNVIKLTLPEEGIRVESSCDNWWDVPCATDETGVTPDIKKTLKAEDVVGGYNLQLPFKLTQDELDELRLYNIPIKTYTFGVEMDYTYSLEGSGVVNTRPFG
jgi:hypothetical protein